MTAMTAGQRRRLRRSVHLLAGALLLGYIYAHAPRGVQHLVRLVVVPLLWVTGVAMWQAPRIRRLRKAIERRRAPAPGRSSLSAAG